MKKKISVSFLALSFAIGIIISSNIYKSDSLISSVFILENAEALAGECGSGKVEGSPMSGTCNTPMSSENKKKCTTTIITCQGSTNCCERKSCSLH